MLFDLQSGKRRRVVQVVFGTLAVIFAVSFVFFGVGSEAGFNPFAADGGGDGSEPFKEDIEAAEERLATNPNDTAALAELVELRYQAGSRLLEVDEATGQINLTTEAEEELLRGADAWDRYLKAAKGQTVDGSAALLAEQTFATLGQGLIIRAAQEAGQPALDDADDAIAAYADAGEAKLRTTDPSASDLVRAAGYFYLGGDVKAGDAAGEQALAAAADAKEREQVQKALDAAKQQGLRLNQQIEAYRKQLEQAGAGAPDTGQSPLGDLGGGLGGGGGSLATP